MKRASYREAIAWIAENDDVTYALHGSEHGAPVSILLVADLFDVPVEKVAADLRRYFEKENRR